MLESFSREFVDVINEAEQLKQDLNMIMENVVDLSRSLVDGLDAQVINNNQMVAINEDKTGDISPHNTNAKIRIYELAKELKLSSKQLLEVLINLGYKYNSHMNTLDDDIVEMIKRYIKVAEDEDTKNLNSELIDVALNENENSQSVNIEQIKKAHPYLAVRILHDQGYNIKEIAKLLGRGQGEINLLLNLSKKSKAI